MVQQKENAKELLREWILLINKGMSKSDAAEKIGVPRETLYRYKKKFYPDLTVTKVILNKDDEPIRSVEGLRENSDVSTEGMTIKKVTENPYGGKYVTYVNPNQPSIKEIRKELIASMKKYAPKYPKIKRGKKNKEKNLLVISIADIHMGKYAAKTRRSGGYSMDIAERRAKEGQNKILDRTNLDNIGQILFVIGNDICHIDSPGRKTTAGTPQDTDGMWHEAFVRARKLYVDLIEQLMPIAPVHIVHNPSNHDYMTGWMVAETVAAWFHSSDVTFDLDAEDHRKYYQFGENLIGTTHGDSAKEDKLMGLMADEEPKDWAKSKYRYWYCHHRHSKHSVEKVGGVIEFLRSVSESDAWHRRKGFVSLPAAEAFLHHPTEGQIGRITAYVD